MVWISIIWTDFLKRKLWKCLQLLRSSNLGYCRQSDIRSISFKFLAITWKVKYDFSQDAILILVQQQPWSCPGRLIVEDSRSQTIKHTHTYTLGRTPLDEWSARRRGRYLHNTLETQETNIHPVGGFWTWDASNKSASDGTAIGIGTRYSIIWQFILQSWLSNTSNVRANNRLKFWRKST